MIVLWSRQIICLSRRRRLLHAILLLLWVSMWALWRRCIELEVIVRAFTSWSWWSRSLNIDDLLVIQTRAIEHHHLVSIVSIIHIEWVWLLYKHRAASSVLRLLLFKMHHRVLVLVEVSILIWVTLIVIVVIWILPSTSILMVIVVIVEIVLRPWWIVLPIWRSLEHIKILWLIWWLCLGRLNLTISTRTPIVWNLGLSAIFRPAWLSFAVMWLVIFKHIWIEKYIGLIVIDKT